MSRCRSEAASSSRVKPRTPSAASCDGAFKASAISRRRSILGSLTVS
jgi:hypothetical protein